MPHRAASEKRSAKPLAKRIQLGIPGLGPAQLALALLADTAGDPLACLLYQDFKREWVASWNEDSFSITAEEIMLWMEGKGFDKERIEFIQDLRNLQKQIALTLKKHARPDEDDIPKDLSKAHSLLNEAAIEIRTAENLATKQIRAGDGPLG